MRMAVADFANWAFKMDKGIDLGAPGSMSVYIVLDKFCAIPYINDPQLRYLHNNKGAKGSGISGGSPTSIQWTPTRGSMLVICIMYYAWG